MLRKPNVPNYLLFFRDDLRLSTWILWGACLQSILVLFLPCVLALLPAAAVLAARIITSLLQNQGLLPNPYFKDVRLGRSTAQIPNDDGSFPDTASAKDICIFVIATRSHHPKGRFGPGLDEITAYFRAMWQDLHENREKWGYLGKTPALGAIEEDCTNTLIWISYWKSLEYLHAFARGESHRAGWDWWNGEKKFPHIGLQHEVYFAPKGHWENIAHNFRPFGIGRTQHVVHDSPSDKKGHLMSPIMPTIGSDWKSMKSRMARTDVS